MTTLVIGLVIFFLPHLLRELGLRQRLVDGLGSEGAYKGLYSLVALAGLGLIIYGKSIAPFSQVWTPVFELRWLSHLLMLPAFILVAAGNLPRSYMADIVKNPMLLGVVIWGMAHLWSNGDMASALLFGSFTLWAGLKFVTMGLRSTSARKTPRFIWDLVAFFVGCVVYVLVFVFHGQLFGIGISFAV